MALDKRMQILLSADDIKMLQTIADAYGWSRSQAVRQIIRATYRWGVAGGGTTTPPPCGHWSLVSDDSTDSDDDNIGPITWPDSNGAIIV